MKGSELVFNQRAIELKRKLAAGEFSPGIWVSLPSPTACEIIAGAGLDWIVVDGEHCPFNPETLQHMLMAFKGSQTVPLIRVPWNDQVMIKQALDMGWDGVVIPQVNSVEDARRAVAACRYPPAGNRGFGPFRASNYYRDGDEYVRLADDSVICMIQIENVTGAEQIDEIVRVQGVDWIFFGLCDMSPSAGRFLDLENPEIWKAVRKIIAAAQDAGIPTGNPIGKPVRSVEDIEEMMGLGCQLIVLGSDYDMLKHALDKAVEAFHEAAGRMGPNRG